jgi:hypothetical protein
MRSALLLFPIAALLALAGCGDKYEASTTPEPADPPPPLFYAGPVAEGPVPAWLARVKPLRSVGHWRHAVPSPDGKTILAQWSGECEIPIAYFIPLDTRKPRPVFPIPQETTAVAWNDDGRAGVFVNGPACGGGDVRPGLYLVSLDGEREFVTDDVDEVERWQAARI